MTEGAAGDDEDEDEDTKEPCKRAKSNIQNSKTEELSNWNCEPEHMFVPWLIINAA